jgi:hypothetical protein
LAQQFDAEEVSTVALQALGQRVRFKQPGGYVGGHPLASPVMGAMPAGRVNEKLAMGFQVDGPGKRRAF